MLKFFQNNKPMYPLFYTRIKWIDLRLIVLVFQLWAIHKMFLFHSNLKSAIFASLTEYVISKATINLTYLAFSVHVGKFHNN